VGIARIAEIGAVVGGEQVREPQLKARFYPAREKDGR
jgi:hypothetical protein